MVTDGDYTYSGEHWIIYNIVESLCCTPETKITSYVNYISILKEKEKRNRESEQDFNKKLN